MPIIPSGVNTIITAVATNTSTIKLRNLQRKKYNKV